MGASTVENGASVGASTYEVKTRDLPGFLFFFVIVVGIVVVVVALCVLVKLLIFKDVIVFVVVDWAGIHGSLRENYSAAGFAAAGAAAGAAVVAPGCVG